MSVRRRVKRSDFGNLINAVVIRYFSLVQAVHLNDMGQLVASLLRAVMAQIKTCDGFDEQELRLTGGMLYSLPSP